MGKRVYKNTKDQYVEEYKDGRQVLVNGGQRVEQFPDGRQIIRNGDQFVEIKNGRIIRQGSVSSQRRRPVKSINDLKARGKKLSENEKVQNYKKQLENESARLNESSKKAIRERRSKMDKESSRLGKIADKIYEKTMGQPRPAPQGQKLKTYHDYMREKILEQHYQEKWEDAVTQKRELEKLKKYNENRRKSFYNKPKEQSKPAPQQQPNQESRQRVLKMREENASYNDQLDREMKKRLSREENEDKTNQKLKDLELLDSVKKRAKDHDDRMPKVKKKKPARKVVKSIEDLKTRAKYSDAELQKMNEKNMADEKRKMLQKEKLKKYSSGEVKGLLIDPIDAVGAGVGALGKGLAKTGGKAISKLKKLNRVKRIKKIGVKRKEQETLEKMFKSGKAEKAKKARQQAEYFKDARKKAGVPERKKPRVPKRNKNQRPKPPQAQDLGRTGPINTKPLSQDKFAEKILKQNKMDKLRNSVNEKKWIKEAKERDLIKKASEFKKLQKAKRQEAAKKAAATRKAKKKGARENLVKTLDKVVIKRKAKSASAKKAAATRKANRKKAAKKNKPIQSIEELKKVAKKKTTRKKTTRKKTKR